VTPTEYRDGLWPLAAVLLFLKNRLGGHAKTSWSANFGPQMIKGWL